MDLNLLKVFIAVYELGSLTATAERLFMSQPAVSQALGRMRRELDDPLFQREGGTMVPSMLADSLYPDFRDSLSRIEQRLDEVKHFSPAVAERRFRIALSELGEFGYLPTIVAAVRKAAPGVGIDVSPLDIGLLPQWLSRGSIDLAITSSPVPAEFEGTTIKSETYVALLSEEHPLSAGELTLEAYENADHVFVNGDSGRLTVEHALRQAGIAIRPAVTVNRFSAVPRLVRTSGLVATVPSGPAFEWERSLGVMTRPLPFRLAPLEVRVYRRPPGHQTAALRWFHDLVLGAITR
ncbi:LysR family transcriptional regulator [Herbiconiux daphne]|uniref:LysR family transcriptional regulator n=1 Tax=Herbiconiux daphne TaxID=2970914 RepID=A0ABT2H3K1_9MICO|nr:LysR family transcriptional regulator [Herbiconiux daphne]MCS5734513.1 LysR family transcriptional regulator [Herbiconiux daphne]